MVVDTMTVEAFFGPGVDQFSKDLDTLIKDIFKVPVSQPDNPDPTLPDDSLTIFANIKDYILGRYSSFELMYPDFNVFDRLICAKLKTNALEFAKVVMVWRTAYLQYKKLLIGDTASNSTAISYTGLNATGTYSTTTNSAESANVFDALTKVVNSAQTEVYLFIDRIIQPLLKLIY